MLERDNIQLTNAHLVTEALLIPQQRIDPPGSALANCSVASVVAANAATWTTVVLALTKASFAHELECQSNAARM
jgi:hypothetical protein